MKAGLCLVVLIFTLTGCADVDPNAEVRQKALLARFDAIDKDISSLSTKVDGINTQLDYEVRDLNESRPLIGHLTSDHPLTKGETVHLDDDVYEVESIVSFAPAPLVLEDTKYYTINVHRVFVRFVSKATKAPKD